MSAASRLVSETVYSAASVSPEENNKNGNPRATFCSRTEMKSNSKCSTAGWTRLAHSCLLQQHNSNALNRGQSRSTASLHFNGFISLLSLPTRTRDSKEIYCTQTAIKRYTGPPTDPSLFTPPPPRNRGLNHFRDQLGWGKERKGKKNLVSLLSFFLLSHSLTFVLTLTSEKKACIMLLATKQPLCEL